jgi:hypothetical protein
MYEITKNVMQDANLSAATKIVMAVISQGVKSNTQSNISYSALASITAITIFVAADKFASCITFFVISYIVLLFN